MSTADERLSQFLNEGQAWEKKVTNIAGVFLVKLPTFRGIFSITCYRNKPYKCIWFCHKEKRGNNKITTILQVTDCD